MFRIGKGSRMIISRSQKFALLFSLLLALVITACGGGASPTATEAPTEPAETTESEPTEDASEVEATESPSEAEAAVDMGVVADTFPCAAKIVEGDGLMRILMRQPSATAPLVGARRGGQDVQLGGVVTADDGSIWYDILENRLTVGYIAQEYIILGDACVSGGAGAEATGEAAEEATAEATEE
jgi:hypothetical protein